MHERSFRYRPESPGKRAIAWFLLWSFFLQCVPAGWALPTPPPLRPTSLSELLPKGLPPEVMPRLPNPLAGIADPPERGDQPYLVADEPEHSATEEPKSSPTPTPEPTETQTPRRFRVTPENLRAREQKRLQEEATAKPAASDHENESAGEGDSQRPHEQPSGPQPSPTPTLKPDPSPEAQSDESESADEPAQSQWPELKKKPQMAVIYAPSQLPGEPEAEISRLPHPASVYSALSPTNPAYLQDRALVFKKTYTNLNNPGETSVWWDFYSPNPDNNKTRRRTSASIEFSYRSVAHRACDREARYKLEIRLFDNKHPGGKRLPYKESKTHLEQLVAYAGIVAPDAGVWHWIEHRDHQQLSDTTFEVTRLGGAPAAWTRRISGQLDTILLPFAAHTSDDWLIRSKEYTFPSFEDGPATSVSHFQAEWNWFAPVTSHGQGKGPYLKVKTDYLSDGTRYRLLVRAFDQAYPSGRIVRLQEADGWLPEATITYGVGLPISGVWRLQEKIAGVETECLTMQVRDIAVGVEAPNLIWLDNQAQVYKLNLFSGPSDYKVKNFKWTLELRNPATQALVRSYTGQVADNTQNALSWEQIWDGKDQDGNLVALGTSVTAQLRVEVPKDPTDTSTSFEDTVEKWRHEIHDVPQRQIAPSLFHHQHKHDAYHPGPTVASGQGGQGPGGGSGGGGSNPSGRFFMMTGFDQTKGVSHKGKLLIYLPEIDTVSVPGAGRLVFASSTAPIIRFEELPFRIDTPDGNPPKYIRIEFEDGFGNQGCGDWGEIYLRASDGTYSQRVFPSRSEFSNLFIPPIPLGACIVWAWVTVFMMNPLQPQATASSPPGQPTPVVSASGYALMRNHMSVGGGPVDVGLDVGSGLYSHSETDLALETRGIPAVLTRHWHSGGNGLSWGTIYPNDQQNLFRSQSGWIWNFQHELSFSDNGTKCRLIKPEGGEDAFEKNTSGGWTPARADMTDRLTPLDATHFQIETKGHFFYKYQLPDQIQSTFAGARAFLVQERDMHNNQLNYEWDPRGDRLQVIREGGTNRALMTLDWGTGPLGSPDAWLQLRSVRDFTGRTVTYTYQDAPAPFNNQAFLSGVSQPGNVTLSYLYNAQAIQKAQPGALNVPPQLLSTPQRKTFYQTLANYDLSISLREVLRNNVSQATFANADPKGALLRETNRQSLMTYRRELGSPVPGAQIRLLSIPSASPSNPRAFDFSFNSQGRPTDIWDSQGQHRKFEFDPAANLRKYISSLNQESTFDFDGHRNMIQSQDPAGNIYKLSFDDRDRLFEIKNPRQGIVHCTYNGLDELTRIVDEDLRATAFTYSPTGKLASMTNALSHTWNYQYNSLGFLAQVSEPQVGNLQPVWSFTPDSLGRVTSESCQGVVLKQNTYDVRDRVTSTTLLETNFPGSVPAQRTTRYAYNNFDQLQSVTDPLNRTTTMQFDAKQRYISTTRPDGSKIGRTYDAQGDVVSHYNGAGFSTTYQFDSMHRITMMTHPGNGGRELFAYDTKGRLDHWTKTDNTVVRYQYDLLDRVFRIFHQGNEKIHYTYDELSRVTRMEDQVGPTRYSYSPGSDLLRVDDAFNRGIVYGYDPAHQLLSRTDQQNVETRFIYNARGQVAQAVHDGLTADYQYNALGAPTQVAWNHGLNEQYAYSSQGEAMTRSVTFPGQGAIESESVTRDGLGRKSQVAFTTPGALRTHNYTYSLIGQLTGSTRRLQPSGGPLTTRTYGYDGADNRVRKDLQTSAFNPADQITSITGAATPFYSPSGSLSDDASAHFAYDWREQMEHYVRGSTDARYAYNGNNLRVEKVVNGDRTQYLLDGGEVLKEYNGDGTVKASYFLGATGRQAIKVNGVWYIYLKDTHGSVTGLVDLAGNRVATYEADPYGEPLVDVNPNNIYNPYRWNGEQLDAESGLTYMRNRYYQAATGRFIQRDPISYAGGLNLYSFPTDPINSADPTGLQPNVTDYGRVLAEREAAQKLFRAYQEWAEANIYPTEGTSDVSFPLLGDFLTGKALGSLMRLPGRAVARSAGAGARHVGAAGADELFHEGLVFSREELLKGGEVIAKGANGAGEIPGIRDIAKLVKEHGGKPRDWEKVKNFIGATEQTSGDLVGPLRMHYYRNATTGQIAKFGEKELQSGQW